MINQQISSFLASASALLFLAGCGGSHDTGAGEMTMDTAVAITDSTPAGTAASSNAMEAQTPDQQFLQRMSDHHVGLVQMGQQAQQRATQDTVKNEARHFAVGQTNSMKEMQRMLQEQFSDSHQPTVMPRHAAVVDSLSQLQGAQYDRAFVEKVISHHKGGIEMINQYLPTAVNAPVKVMAEKMKTVQQEDIKRLEGLLAKL